MFESSAYIDRASEIKRLIKAADTPELQKKVREMIADLLGGSEMRLKQLAEELGFELKEQVKRKRKSVTVLIEEELEKRFPKLKNPVSDSKPDEEPELPKNIRFKTINETFLPPDTKEIRFGNDAGEFKKAQVFPRTRLAIEMLEQMGVNLEECKFLEGVNMLNMIRQKSYRAIIIPSLQRTILVCDEEGNRTFVAYGIDNIERFYRLRKSKLRELVEEGLLADLVWCESDEWQLKLMELLNAKPKIKTGIKKKGNAPQLEKSSMPRDKEYYSNPEYVRSDLERFTEELGEWETPLDVNTGNISKLEITCSNGEKVKGATYLLNAGVALGMAKGIKEAQSKQAEILKTLLKTAGYEVRDKDYYSSPEYMRADLEAFAQQLGEWETPLDLSTSNIVKFEITCSNGEKVKGTTYLLNAGVALGIAKNAKEAGSKQAEILKTLLKTVGYEIKEYKPRDKEYYSNLEHVRSDLEALAEQLGKGKTPLDVNTGNISKLEITCSNGEKVKGATYLLNAGVALGMAKDAREASSQLAEILKTLLKTAGYEVRDKDYYSSPEYVKVDLEAFAKQLGEGKTPLDLSTKNITKLEITCSNGEKKIKGIN